MYIRMAADIVVLLVSRGLRHVATNIAMRGGTAILHHSGQLRWSYALRRNDEI